MREEDATLRGLFATLEESPADPVCLSALADWSEERGDSEAADCLRWAVRNGLRPGRVRGESPYGNFFWERKEQTPILNDPLAQLPEQLWLAVGDNEERHAVGSFKSYRTARAAYLALLTAWRRIGGEVKDLPR